MVARTEVVGGACAVVQRAQLPAVTLHSAGKPISTHTRAKFATQATPAPRGQEPCTALQHPHTYPPGAEHRPAFAHRAPLAKGNITPYLSFTLQCHIR